MCTEKGYIHQLFSLEGKTAVVTGAAGGIGGEIALALALAGANVAACDIDLKGAERTVQEITNAGETGVAMALDLTSLPSIRQTVAVVMERFKRLDILVNCAGINKREPILAVQEETFDKIIGVNLKGLFFLSQAAAEIMKERGGGKIINFGSLTSAIGLGDVAPYTATKGGVAQLSKTMAVEWAKYNINVNCVCPGFIKTPLTAPLWVDEKRNRWMLDRIALERPGVPADIAGTVIFLAAPASDYITGTVHFVDGGFMAGGKTWEANV